MFDFINLHSSFVAIRACIEKSYQLKNECPGIEGKTIFANFTGHVY